MERILFFKWLSSLEEVKSMLAEFGASTIAKKRKVNPREN